MVEVEVLKMIEVMVGVWREERGKMRLQNEDRWISLKGIFVILH